MKLRMVGCHQRATDVDVRDKLSFSRAQVEQALSGWRAENPGTEAVLLSTCNRVELYAAVDGDSPLPRSEMLFHHLADFHDLPIDVVQSAMVSLADEQVVRHLFRVAASLDSMVVGEPQILAQVKQAYDRACQIGSTGPVTHEFFQSALRAARRVANETSLHRCRVSIPSIAVADFACSIFERFDDKRVLVIGAGEMAEETIRYLCDAGAAPPTVVNRNFVRAEELAEKWGGRSTNWTQLDQELSVADVAVSTTGSEEPIMKLERFRHLIAPARNQKPLFILDLATPRDFEPQIGRELATYLYSIDDLTVACDENRRRRRSALPLAEAIVEQETIRFLSDSRHRDRGPVISQLRNGFDETKRRELVRLFQKLPDLDDDAKEEIEQFADRVVGKILHPPLKSLRDESNRGSQTPLLDALKRLFQLGE